MYLPLPFPIPLINLVKISRKFSTGKNEVDVLFIGGGPGGYVGAIKAAQLGLKVRLFNRNYT